MMDPSCLSHSAPVGRGYERLRHAAIADSRLNDVKSGKQQMSCGGNTRLARLSLRTEYCFQSLAVHPLEFHSSCLN
jgi:hypothetical protein